MKTKFSFYLAIVKYPIMSLHILTITLLSRPLFFLELDYYFAAFASTGNN